MHRNLESFIFPYYREQFLCWYWPIVFEVGRVAYRLNWHPLARLLGSKIAGGTNLYGAYYDLILDGYLCKKAVQLDNVYGPFSIVKLSTYYSAHIMSGPIVRIASSEVHLKNLKSYNNLVDLT